MKKFTPLGALSPSQFLRNYWQKKPLLIRQAFPGFQPLLDRNALFTLAARDDVESRLVTHDKQHWQISHGPLPTLPATSKKNWSLLLQGMNLHNDAVDQLMQQFRFIPDARLDDLMISYATDQGGVGPHFDSYDVFLLQAHGQRRWRIGAQDDLALVEGAALKILKNFKPEQEFVLNPGDMLYLPPHYAHDGVALGECMTYSIGFRSPSFQELGEAFLQFMADSIDLPGRYSDPDLRTSSTPAALDRAMLSQIGKELNKVRFTADDITLFTGEYLSEPKATTLFSPPPRKLSRTRFLAQAERRGVRLAPASRMLYRSKHLFVNGESFDIARDDQTVLHQLANQRRLDLASIQTASSDVKDALHLWYQDGWLFLN
ncbi:MAG: cupin domain-containing protein [Herbaspirillum sp.]